MIFYNGDDPATGSAAGCCAAWMVAHGVAASEEQVLIEQGLEMHRPSSIFVRAKKAADNQVVNVRVGGNCVEVLRGEVTTRASSGSKRCDSRGLQRDGTIVAIHQSAIGERATLPRAILFSIHFARSSKKEIRYRIQKKFVTTVSRLGQ